MENTMTKKSKSLKYGFAIKFLSITALICTVYELAVRPLYFWNLRNILSFILTLTPVVLLVLYIFKFRAKLKATIFVPIIFGVLGLNTIFNFLLVFGYYNYFFGFSSVELILDLAKLVCLILALISALKGFNKKVFVIVAMAVCLLYEALSLITIFRIIRFYIEDSMYLYLFESLMSIVGSSTFYIALLLFALKNKIPSILALSPKKAGVEKMNPEQALKLLKDKLDLDMITEEEYQSQRAEIISKL